MEIFMISEKNYDIWNEINGQMNTTFNIISPKMADSEEKQLGSSL